MIQDLRKRMEKMQETFTKDLKEWRNKQTKRDEDMLEGTNSRTAETEDQISDLEDRMAQIIAAEQNIEKKNEKN